MGPASKEYLAACREYQVTPSGDVLSFLLSESRRLKVYRFRGSKPFGDLDMYPLVDVLRSNDSILERLQVLDLSEAQWLGPSSVMLVVLVLGLPRCRIEALDFSFQRPTSEGVAVLAGALRSPGGDPARGLRSLKMNSCHFGDAGGEALAGFLRGLPEAHGLQALEAQNNWLSFDACQGIAVAADLAKRVEVNLKGNQVMDEVLNAVSHGLGVVLAIVGSVFLGIAVYDKPPHYKQAIVLYSVALHTLYFASTLYHSLHATGAYTVWVFGILDHCAIYLLIAGSYCPFLWILFPGDPLAGRLLVLLWTMAVAGMFITAFYQGPKKGLLETSLYLVMGWSCLAQFGEMTQRLGPQGTQLLVAGGLFYTGGVPFFIKNGRSFGIPDHTIWHMFVLAGSAAHYFCVLVYCVSA